MEFCEDIWSQVFIYLNISDIKKLVNIYPSFNSIINVKYNWINKLKYENKEKYVKYLINDDFMNFYETLVNIDDNIKFIIDKVNHHSYHYNDNTIISVGINKNVFIEDITEIIEMMRSHTYIIENILNPIEEDINIYTIEMCMARSNAMCYNKVMPIGKIDNESYYRLFELLILNKLISTCTYYIQYPREHIIYNI